LSGSPVSGQSVTVSQEPLGASAFTTLATLTTGNAGDYSTTAKPSKQTVYEAVATGVATPPTVTVKVAQRLKLSVRRKGAKVYLKGSLGPKKSHRLIVIQVRTGKRWHKLGSARTTKRSTFTLVRALKGGHVYMFRAKTGGYPGLLAGTSRTVRLRR
jgi:hypothetical protein